MLATQVTLILGFLCAFFQNRNKQYQQFPGEVKRIFSTRGIQGQIFLKSWNEAARSFPRKPPALYRITCIGDLRKPTQRNNYRCYIPAPCMKASKPMGPKYNTHIWRFSCYREITRGNNQKQDFLLLTWGLVWFLVFRHSKGSFFPPYLTLLIKVPISMPWHVLIYQIRHSIQAHFLVSFSRNTIRITSHQPKGKKAPMR